MRIPSDEQRAAIESTGSVLLSAGAGSGKTYVLVEHIVFLTKKFIEKERRIEVFPGKIKKYFSAIVLITFTRKSTAEIRLRMKRRMEEEVSQEGAEKIYWRNVLEALPLLTISTIHGFCSLLLRQGFLPGFGRSFEIMNEIEGKKRIEKLFVEWFECEKEKDSFEREKKDYDVIVANRRSIVNGLVKIFNDPVLRKSWKGFGAGGVVDGLATFMERYLECTGLNKTLVETCAMETGGKPKKWQLLLQEFYELREQHAVGTVEGIEAFGKFFSSGTISSPRGAGGNEDIKKHIEDIRKLKKFFQDYGDDLVAFEKHREEMDGWVRLFHSAFSYIEKHYRRNPKMSYSDLEYYVDEGLENRETVDKISALYQYIVVDEFQDTSNVQFDIIKKIVKENYEKLFCVGDHKQAIYGFRGGEVAVFEQCQKEVKNNLELVCNFRSEKTVVEFNNKFFSTMLNCGDSFEHVDLDKNGENLSKPLSENEKMTFSFQKSQRENDEGIVSRHKVIVSESNPDVGKIEAQKIFDVIDSMRREGNAQEVAVLYNRLAPSKLLMEHLISNKIPFVAQVKIPYGEDFAVGLCMILLEFYLSCREGKHSWEKLLDYPKFMILSYFNLMGLEGPEKLTFQLKKFLNNVHLYGFESAYCVFVYDLGISNSNHGQNIKMIKDLYEMYGEDWESIYNSLKKNSDEKYSMDVHFGERGSDEIKIVIMTVHSSKGLEFEHVILGGVNSAPRSGGGSDYIGRHPSAIRWKSSSRQKRPFCSPGLILEKYVSSQKDFAESKRLFYVACTRAVRGLHWVDVLVEKKSVNDKRWVRALRKWCDLSLADGLKFREFSWNDDGGGSVPACGADVRGVVERDVKNPSIILPEISVSGFVSVTQCPRKFYLQNVCRFDRDDVWDSFGKGAGVARRKEGPVSSAARGSALHEKISEMIGNRWEGLSGIGDGEERRMLEWVKKSLSGFYELGAEIFSEIPVKFSLSGQVISGTADLVAFGRDRDFLEVWDFKTGRRDESYWFQLLCYAYGFAGKYALRGGQAVNVAVVYLDKREITKKTLYLSQIKDEIEREWLKMDNLTKTNGEHCSSCCYQNLCHP